MLFLSSRVSHILRGGRIKIIQILLFPTKSHWVAPKYYSCWISTGHSRTSSITAPQLSDHNWPSGSNFGSTDSTGKLVWTWASLWLSQSQCQPVCVMYWSSVSVLVQCWLCNVNNYIFFFPDWHKACTFCFSGMMWDTPPPPPPPNPTTKQQTPNFSFSAYLLYVVQTHLLLEGPAVAASPIMHCTLLLLFIPLIFFFAELSDSWKASKTKWEHKAKVGLLSFS